MEATGSCKHVNVKMASYLGGLESLSLLWEPQIWKSNFLVTFRSWKVILFQINSLSILMSVEPIALWMLFFRQHVISTSAAGCISLKFKIIIFHVIWLIYFCHFLHQVFNLKIKFHFTSYSFMYFDASMWVLWLKSNSTCQKMATGFQSFIKSVAR
jgi:hypothetical protein